MTDPAPCCAGFYETDLVRFLLGESFHPGGSALTRRLGALAALHRGAHVLDLGSGRGGTGAALTRDFGCRVVSLDYSHAHAKAAKGVAGDARKLPFASATFDALICECALCTFGDVDAALREMWRVLRPGGRVGISDMVLRSAVPEELQGLFGQVLCIAGARSEQGYVDALTGAGFTSVRVHDVSQALLDMVDGIAKRLRLARELGELGDVSMPVEFGDPDRVLDAAREFVDSDGLGYGIFVGRRPRGSAVPA